ncbi:hypothetical protein [Mycoplasma procyoni]|uniref:hypothetical protein n=1 Tax=Mycoplasma procyoni TaxID=568784 RepID=UPI00197B5108|nr:hypothetical protein [Mycoplasma procyoni]MBN3534696.1 hypothetical protein [Mycoplasma procyoni]
MKKPPSLWFKERGFVPNYWNVTRRKNIHVKMGDKDILFFIQNRDEDRTVYITNNPDQHYLVVQWDYPEDIIYIPNLFHDLKKLDKIDKFYIHGYLLKFFAENENKSGYNWSESGWYIYDRNMEEDWEKTLRIFKKRYPEFAKIYTKENMLDWIEKISGSRKTWPKNQTVW